VIENRDCVRFLDRGGPPIAASRVRDPRFTCGVPISGCASVGSVDLSRVVDDMERGSRTRQGMMRKHLAATMVMSQPNSAASACRTPIRPRGPDRCDVAVGP